MPLLSDAEVFGAKPLSDDDVFGAQKPLSDADVFGTPASPPSKLFKPEYLSTDAEPSNSASRFFKRAPEPEVVQPYTPPSKWPSREQMMRETEDEFREQMKLEKPSWKKVKQQLALAPQEGWAGLKQQMAGALRVIPTMPPIVSALFSQSAKLDQQEIEEASQKIGGGPISTGAKTIAATGISSAPSILAAPAGLAGMATVAGVQTFGSVKDDAYNSYIARGETPKSAEAKSNVAASLAGAGTMLLTRLMPGGTEALAQKLVSGQITRAAGEGMVKTVLKESLKEFPEEALDQVSQGIIAKFSYRPEMTWEQIGDDAVKAGLTGSALAGLMGGVALPTAKGISRLRRGNAMRDSISTDEPQGVILTDENKPRIERDVYDVARVPTRSEAEISPVVQENLPQEAQQIAPQVISGAPAAVAPEGTGVKAVVAPVLPPTDVPNRNPLIQIEGPDGKLHWFTMDGYQDFTGITLGGIERGVEPQLTAVEASPGKGIIKGGTTYGYRLTEEGYKLPSTLPTAEEIAAHRAAKTESVENQKTGIGTSERVVEAAYNLSNGKVIKTGAFHDGSKLPKSNQSDPGNQYTDVKGATPGFITSTGRFVGRDEAAVIGKKSGQMAQDEQAPAWHGNLDNLEGSTIQKFRIGRSPQTYSLVEELPATPIEITNKEQVVRVKNERTGEVTDVLKSQLVPVNTGTAGVKTSRDLDAELTYRKLDPSVFPNAKAKRAAIERHDALNKRTNRQVAEEIAAKLEGLKSGKKPGDLHLFGVVSLVWDTAITIAQKTFLATGSVADAVRDAINYIRANNGKDFDEAGASEFLGRSVEPSADFIDPEPDESDEPSEGHTVNISGRTYDVISKDKLTPEQHEAGDAAAQATFQSMGIPGVPDKTVDKRPGSIDNNTVWRVVPDGQNHDAEAEALREHLIEQIQIQNSPEGDASYVSSLINAINMNFDHGRWRDVISQPVLESLLNVSVGESSKRGTLLRQIRGISNDMRAIAQNAELRLKWVYQETFDPDGLVTKILAKVREIAGENATIEQKKLALIKILSGLTPQEKAKVNKTKIGRLIEKVINSGMLDDNEVFKLFAKDQGWDVPTDKEITQMREWKVREDQLRTPTSEEISKHGGNVDAAKSALEAATLDSRKELLRKMNIQWSKWIQPIITNWRDLFNPEKVKNTNTAFNEWVAANLLLKIGFGTRQIVDVGTQMVLNTPTRALGYAFENWSNDISEKRDSNLQHSIAESITDAYRTRIKVLIPALHSFKQTLKGKGEQRQVEQLISSIGIFDRMLLNAEKMRAEGKRGAANLLQVIAIGMRMGRQFAAAMDVVHGIPAEAQEIAHLVRNGLREKGLSKGAVEVQFNEIMGLLTTHRAEALSLASEMLSLRGEDTSSGAVERAAWHILRDKIYNAAQQAELKADDWKKQNALYRDLIGWNLSETKGMQGIGGLGGLVALGGKAAKEMFSKVPLVGGLLSIPFTFSNAMGISVNRKLAWSPLGFFPGMFKGSPHWEGEANIRQRKVEAAIGTGISGVIFTLIISGVWKALPSFWPKDEKERDKWVKNGWSPGMVLIPWGNGQELHLSTRTGPLAFFAPTIAAAAAYTQKQEDRAKKQASINQRAAKLGVQPEQLPDFGMVDWMGVMFQAGYSSLTGGRTASGAISAYTDYGTFNVKKATASELSAFTPGLPAINEFARLAGGNVNPKLASFWDMLVPMPTSNAQRVNVLGDPMRDENDYRRIFTILSGGNFPFPTSATPAETQAYAALFGSDYRPPSIDPSRGYQISGKLRPFNGNELQAYTTARGQEFKRELASLGVNPATEDVKAAYVRANQRALTSVGVTLPSRKLASTPRRTSSRRLSSRLRGGRSLRLRGRRGLRMRLGRRRRRLALR